MKFQEIPHTWLIAGLGISLVLLRFMSIDSWTTAALSSLMGYLLGKHIEQCNSSPLLVTTKSKPCSA
jgi:hypothetical protein